MRKIFVLSILAIFFSFTFVNRVKANEQPCSDIEISLNNNPFGEFPEGTKKSMTFDLNVSKLAEGKYHIAVFENSKTVADTAPLAQSDSFEVTNANASTPVEKTIDEARAFNFDYFDTGLITGKDDKNVYLRREYTLPNDVTIYSDRLCKLGSYTMATIKASCSEPLRVYQDRIINGENKRCYTYNGEGCIEANTPINVEINGVEDIRDNPINALHLKAEKYIGAPGVLPNWWTISESNVKLNSVGSLTWQISGQNAQEKVKISVPSSIRTIAGLDRELDINGACTTPSEFTVAARCNEECVITPPTSGVASVAPFKICEQINDSALKEKCKACAGNTDQGGVWTAIGCISRDPVAITKRFIEVGLGIGGGVALIMTLAGGFILSTSQGDPQKANQAKEMITNSVIGLLFVIFSVFILQFIGVTILNIPGFGTGTS